VIATLALLGYAACAAWLAPALLTPLTRRGASVRAGLAAWLAAMASVLVSASVATSLALAAAAPDWPRLTQALCRSVAGGACTAGVYRSFLYQAGVALLAVLLALAAVVTACRYGRRVLRSRARTRAHARAALLVGRAIASPEAVAGAARDAVATRIAAAGVPAAGAAQPRAAGACTVMLEDPRPAAYCVAGHPAAIVVTSGALAVLDPPQLRAVLAHESAHLAQGHHALATVTRGLAAALPGVPLFTRGAAEVARLTEMAADDAAARASGRPALVSALLAIATGTAFPVPAAALVPACGPVPAPAPAAVATVSPAGQAPIPRPGLPGPALSAAAHAIPDRVERLLRPATRARSAACTAALAIILTLLTAAPPALTFMAMR
jgi:Zn-dependent protease with chaperone function